METASEAWPDPQEGGGVKAIGGLGRRGGPRKKDLESAKAPEKQRGRK